eukprot:TRINITY_DN5325_c0_g1_i1.p1 TRINITY_DN5325_c0_g1~~TRINITY_DN5325_c0_g1_i1.p1  ORF type:complete len:504 (-),score=111.89 TRINITY_DN5325_c0_g1_i1:78-1589(-)
MDFLFSSIKLTTDLAPLEEGAPVGMGVALSGGGFKASMMSVGALRRLYEIGILRKVTTISSVSGGSITNAVLALAWEKLMEDEEPNLELFDQLVANPVRQICRINVGVHVVKSRLNPVSITKRLKKKLSGELGYIPTHLGQELCQIIPALDRIMSDLPAACYEEGEMPVPRFVFCACDMRTGEPFYFSQHLVGHSLNPTHIEKLSKLTHGKTKEISSKLAKELAKQIPLSQAVGASAAFPLTFEPFDLNLQIRGDHYTLSITDGAVYDNMGLDPLINSENLYMPNGDLLRNKFVFVNDSGAPWFSEELEAVSGAHRISKRNLRCMSIVLSRGHEDRVRILELLFKHKILEGSYWSLMHLNRLYNKVTDPDREELEELNFPPEEILDPLIATRLQAFRTDINRLKKGEIRVLENAGYLLTAFAFHKWVLPVFKAAGIEDQIIRTNFSFPHAVDFDKMPQEAETIQKALKDSYSIFKSNIFRKHHPLHSDHKKRHEINYTQNGSD